MYPHMYPRLFPDCGVHHRTVLDYQARKNPVNTGLTGLFWSLWDYIMVGRDGFEPSTNWLKANCSTN